VFLHVANTLRTRAVRTSFRMEGQTIRNGRVFEITADPTIELSYLNSADVMLTVERPIPAAATWEFPPASVSAVELTMGAEPDVQAAVPRIRRGDQS
jgi:hypothetical protein